MTRNIPILVHTDAAQTIGKLDVNVDDLQVFIFISATTFFDATLLPGFLAFV